MTGNDTNTKGTTMNAYQAAQARALKMIGMNVDDMERTDFFRRSGVKAGKALRSMGYKAKRFQMIAGHGVYATRWAAPASGGEFGQPVSLDYLPAFSVLVMALATEAK